MKKVEEERERCTYNCESSIKPLALQLRSGSSSFDNDSVSCKETGRKEEMERQ